MQYGLYLPNFGIYGDVRLLGDLAAEAESAGWDGFFLWDHVAVAPPTLPVVDPWVALTAVALRTKRLRFGTTVTPLPRRRPWKLARETASLDRLSNGRLVLGVGIGLGQGEWDHLGEEPDRKVRGAMLDEALDVLTGLWTGEPFSYQGAHYHVHEAQFRPTPVQRPRIPVWVGGFWPNKAPFRRMARWDGMFPLFEVVGPDQLPLLKEAVAFVQKQRAAAGLGGPFDVIKLGVTPGDVPAEAAWLVEGAREAGATWWLEVLMPEVYAFAAGDAAALPVLRERVRQGPPSP